MQSQPGKKRKKWFTAQEANAALPLVRAIVEDIAELTREFCERHERLARLGENRRGSLGDAYGEELNLIHDDLDRRRQQMMEFVQELKDLGVELKDPDKGLVDFPAWINGHEVYLCWKLGEPKVAFWHELEAGFAGRQRLTDESPLTPISDRSR